MKIIVKYKPVGTLCYWVDTVVVDGIPTAILIDSTGSISSTPIQFIEVSDPLYY